MSETAIPWTPEERAQKLAETIRLAEFGPPPEEPVVPPSLARRQEPASPDLFSALDLEEEEYRSEPFTMPNGKKVWVHPCSTEEALYINTQALREVKRLNLTDEQEVNTQRVLRARVWQVVTACRQGPEPGAPKVFQPEHAEVLRKRRGYYDAIERICAVSDGLSDGQTESTRLRQAMADFFAAAESRLETCSSLLSAGSPESWASVSEVLAEFAGFVSWSKRQLTP